MSGWKDSGRAASPAWRRVVPAALRRDGFRCRAIMDSGGTGGERCPETTDLEVDHATPWALGGPDTLANAVTLCHWHHAKKSGADRKAIAAARSAGQPVRETHGTVGNRSRKRQPEQHPGMALSSTSATRTGGRGYRSPGLGYRSPAVARRDTTAHAPPPF